MAATSAVRYLQCSCDPRSFLLPFSDTARAAQFAIPVVAGLLGFLYSMLRIRDWLWRPEKEENVRSQIKRAFLDMIPPGLNVTKAERERLLAGEISGELRGVFWESIDGDAELKEQKQFFYKNGILYTSAIDAIFILPAFGIAYYTLALFGFGKMHLIWGTVCLVLFVLLLLVILPKTRDVHMRLSREQLLGIQQRRTPFVQARFTSMIQDWREQKTAQRAP